MNLTHRIFPHPLLSVMLIFVWCLLANSFSLNSLVMGLILGVVIPIATSRYWPNRPVLRNPVGVLGYIFIVLWDIFCSNVVVASQILFRRNADLSPRWVAVPLSLRSPEAITVLAGTITLTPGTVSVDLSSRGHVLLVHCLHAPDPDAVRDEIKSRYERRLMEIFEC